KAAARLRQRGVRPAVIYMVEPGRFREPRSDVEARNAASPDLVRDLYPMSVERRVFVSHTRPAPLIGVLKPLDTGPSTRCLGFIDAGGTLSTPGMLFVNRCTWAHIAEAAAALLGRDAQV